MIKVYNTSPGVGAKNQALIKNVKFSDQSRGGCLEA